jgi:Type II secretion system (T2SS), protein E, N-terminal domain
MRVELTDAGQYPALRDYFQRLGGSVVSEDSLTVDVEFPEGLLDEDESPELYYRTWARTNRLDTRVVEHGGESAAEAVGSFTLVMPPPDPAARPPMRLGELLVKKGLITQDQLSKALVESRRSGDVVGRILIREGWVYESELARVLAEQWSIPYVNLGLIGVDRAALMLLPPEVGRRCAAVPVAFFGHELRVAFADPSNPDVLAEVQTHVAAPIQAAIAELSDIDSIWRSVSR